MKIHGIDIQVFDEFLSFPIRTKKVNLETETFLHFLLQDEYFLKQQKELREEYGIPPLGFPQDAIYESFDFRRNWINGLSLDQNEEAYRILSDSQTTPEKSTKTDKALEFFLHSLTSKQQASFNNTLAVEQKRSQKWFEYFRKGVILKAEPREGQIHISHLQSQMRGDLQALISHYKLPDSSQVDLFLLIAFNSCMHLRGHMPFDFFVDKKLLLYELESAESPTLAILIHEQTSKRQLIQWLNDYWELIEKDIALLPKAPTETSSILAISHEIYLLKEKDKLSFQKISDLLVEKYPDQEYYADEGWIRQTYSRYKKKFLAVKNGNLV
jgi:hypothetical protein